MNFESINLVYFSPTRTTEKIIQKIAEGYRAKIINTVDLTLNQNREAEELTFKDGLTIIGAPVYAGRISLTAAESFAKIKGMGTPAVVVVLYGNREYEDALIELRDIASECGFIPVAGAAFVGEHSYANTSFPIAMGRPDKLDLENAAKFGGEIREKVNSLSNLTDLSTLSVPGNVPYKNRKAHQDISPETIEEKCSLCGTCADVCPTTAITVGDSVVTDTMACIICCACVKNCPEEARVVNDPEITRIAQWLYENYHARKEPELYL